MRAVLIALLVLTLTACDYDGNDAKESLDEAGYTNVVVTDTSYIAIGCGDDDGVAYKATADNPKGRRVNLTVCCGGPLSFKGCTVRYR